MPLTTRTSFELPRLGVNTGSAIAEKTMPDQGAASRRPGSIRPGGRFKPTHYRAAVG